MKQLQDFYTSVHGSYEDAFAALHSDERIQRHLADFCQDPTFASIIEHARRGEFDSMQIQVSALCGLAGYLGPSELANSCLHIIERCHHKKGFCTSRELKECLSELSDEYRLVEQGVKRLSVGVTA
ncbi:MAG: hypothetical protein Q4E12_04380 [Coriobacteriia bacterium]|nr:hypothetical protein [Coriobacteriia bacterium]